MRARGVPTARGEALRTTLWIVPTAMVGAAAVVFAATYAIDRAAYRGAQTLPSWVHIGSADAGRQILIAIAAAVITVVGVVFSITILTLQLASTQFGPRMLRNFIRSIGTQLSLGAFVSTFVYSLVTLGSIAPGRHGEFVPHLSITVSQFLALLDLAVLIFFVHHVATSIQMNQVVAAIASDLQRAVDAQFPDPPAVEAVVAGPTRAELATLLEGDSAVVPARRSGYLQAVGHGRLLRIARHSDAVVELLHRPGHFVVQGLPLARVWPASAAAGVTRDLERAHVTGPHRTLTQDLIFAIDQLVEIALRALSPAVNDTFTGVACVDWLSDGLCRISSRTSPTGEHRDSLGHVRLIEPVPGYERMVDGAFSKIRQSSAAMPAMLIRQLDGLARIMEYTTSDDQRRVLRSHADMTLRAAEATVAEPEDRSDVAQRHARVLAAEERARLADRGQPALHRAGTGSRSRSLPDEPA